MKDYNNIYLFEARQQNTKKIEENIENVLVRK